MPFFVGSKMLKVRNFRRLATCVFSILKVDKKWYLLVYDISVFVMKFQDFGNMV